MHDAQQFLGNLALVLCVAAVTTVVFHRLRQPVVFGYLMAGLIIGPHVPVPLVADIGMVRTLSELGVIFVMFSLGLEFSLRQLARVARTAGTVAVLETSAMLWLGYSIGRLLGWPALECLFAGAAVAISSTTVILKVFREHHVRGAFTQTVFGILIAEDLIAILLVALFTALASGGTLGPLQLVTTIGRLGAFLVALLLVGMLLVPRLIRFVVRLDRHETTLVLCLGLCAGAAYVAQRFGYSVALGAFLAGALVAESGEARRIEKLIEPVRDMFAAIFFVSVGMFIDPALVLKHLPAVLLLAAAVVVGKVGAVSASTFLIGSGTRAAVQTGMSLAQIGEFSFILAGIGLASGATSPQLYPIVIAVSALTTLTTPWLIRAAEPLAEQLDRRLPRPLQTFVALYGSWVENLRARAETSAERVAFHRILRTFAIDALVIVALSVGAALEAAPMGALLSERTGLPPGLAPGVVAVAAVLLSLPFVVGILRTARTLGHEVARRAFPDPEPGRLDLAAAPRHAMILTIQLAAVLVVCAPILAVTQPFLPAPVGVVVLALLVLVIAVALWRTASNLQGHVRAAAEAIVQAVGRHSRSESSEGGARALARAYQLLPGLGEPVPLEIHAGTPGVGRRLGELGLRGRTGATIVAIVRGEEVVLVPDGHETLREGDVVALAGTRPAVEAARALLAPGGSTREAGRTG